MGTFQFCNQTVAELALLLAQSNRGQKVNSVFSEGVNPRLRKLREGLDLLGLSADHLLNQVGPRLIYGVELIENTHSYLLGIDKHPKFIFSQRHHKQFTENIARWRMQSRLPSSADSASCRVDPSWGQPRDSEPSLVGDSFLTPMACRHASAAVDEGPPLLVCSSRHGSPLSASAQCRLYLERHHQAIVENTTGHIRRQLGDPRLRRSVPSTSR
jgi:hypothetical protein